MVEQIKESEEKVDMIVDNVMTESQKKERSSVLKNSVIKEGSYDVDDSFRPASNVDEIHTTEELLYYAQKGQVEIDARVLAVDSSNNIGYAKLDTKSFLEAASSKESKVNFKESNIDYFGLDLQGPGQLVGQDYTPLLGGPFNKQLYMYDYLRMHSASFYAYNHDPMARSIVQIIRDFTLGRGFEAHCENKFALAIWEAFCEANDLESQLDSLALELSIYGETMVWWLPDNYTKIVQLTSADQLPPKGFLPRVRLIDPSCIWEIVTFPEDITRVLYYQWVAPTQYQIYSGRYNDKSVPTSKFIYQQIAANQVMHYKINGVSNEKRGRSDLFPVLGYLKRLRDSVNYSIVGMQKNMAWSIDTTVDGSQQDIDAYVESQQALGTIPMAGSEFVHSKKVERKYLSNDSGRGGNSVAFDWCLSMIAAGSGIPINYFGTHLGGASTRASALVSTEPVTKKFEKRQQVYKRILRDLSQRLFNHFGIKADIEFTFPELVSQDSSIKIKDVSFAQMQGYISKDRASVMVAKELNINDFNVKKEMQAIDKEGGVNPSLSNDPLSKPGLFSAPKTNSALTSDEKNEIVDQNT